MIEDEKSWNIYHIEEFYCKRMEELVDKEEFDSAHSIFEEFVVNGEEPEEYLFIKYHKNIL